MALTIAALAAGLVLMWMAYRRSERANERLKWMLDRADSQAEGLRRQLAIFQHMTALEMRRNSQPVATPSQQTSQEMQQEAPEVVRVLPVAASRLAAYVKEQAAANGQTLSDHEAERMAASMLVESGI